MSSTRVRSCSSLSKHPRWTRPARDRDERPPAEPQQGGGRGGEEDPSEVCDEESRHSTEAEERRASEPARRRGAAPRAEVESVGTEGGAGPDAGRENVAAN